MNPTLNNVANGRRLATRMVVMNTVATIPCLVWRKKVVESEPATATKTGINWRSLALSDQEEPDYEYDEQGHAYMLLDHFTGGNVLENNSMVDGEDTAIFAQIEPYDNEIQSKRDQIITVPCWTPKEGDLFALLIAEGLVLWLEVVTITGQGMMTDFGKKYVLNKRDDLSHKEPFTDELNQRVDGL